MRSTLLAAASAAALIAAAPALAISITAPVIVNDDSAAIDVGSETVVASDDEDVTPIDVRADDVSIDNDGAIEQRDVDGYAITTTGRRTTVANRGAIVSGDRGIEAFDEIENADGDDIPTGSEGLTVINEAGATISSRRQAVRSPAPGATVENRGEIVSVEGRAIQVRGNGATVENHGLLEGGEEVVEGRGVFSLTNYGDITIGRRELGEPDEDGFRAAIGPVSDAEGAVNGLPDDEDGVQFAGGELRNHGLIRGTDDGVDTDEGLIVNHAGARIETVGGGSGVDIDEVYEDEEVERPNGTLRIENAGVIEGDRAVGADEEATNAIEIVNSGVLRGRSGVAVALAPGQGPSTVTLLGASEVYGDILFGGGDDMLTIEGVTSGVLINSEFDGGEGENMVILEGYDFDDIIGFGPKSGGFELLTLLSEGDRLTAPFRNFQTWRVGGTYYDTATLTAATPAPIPLPATLPMLLAGLGAAAALRRPR